MHFAKTKHITQLLDIKSCNRVIVRVKLHTLILNLLLMGPFLEQFTYFYHAYFKKGLCKIS